MPGGGFSHDHNGLDQLTSRLVLSDPKVKVGASGGAGAVSQTDNRTTTRVSASPSETLSENS